MTKTQKKYIATLCSAKDIVCGACHYHNSDACEQCPIANIIDNELKRFLNNQAKAVKELTGVFESDIY